MKKQILSLYLAIASALFSYAQPNLISNGSFEDINSSGDPYNIEFNHYCGNQASSFIFYDGHENTNFDLGVPENSFGNQEPADGQKYGGIRVRYFFGGGQSGCDMAGKIIFNLNDVVHTGLVYSLRFFVSKMDNSDLRANLEVSLDNGQTIYEQDIIDGEYWYEINTTFIPNGESSKLVFDVTNNMTFTNNRTGIYLDNISLYMMCEIVSPCSAAKGPMSPIFSGNPISQNVAFAIDNLANVKSATLKIKTQQSQELIYSKTISCNNGIDGPFYWTGLNSVGALVSNTLYIYELSTLNDCGLRSFSGSVLKTNNFIGTVSDFQCNINNIETPEACCSEQPDIYIDGLTLSGPGNLDYIATNGVYAATESNSIVTVTSNADVLFQGGYEVIMELGFTVHYGAEFIAQVLPCQISGKTDETANNNYYAPGNDADDIVMPDELISQPIEIRIIPNPNNGMFTIQTNTIDAKDILVQNLMGNTVYQSSNSTAPTTEIDLRSFAAGVYIVKVQTQSGQVFVEKVVYK